MHLKKKKISRRALAVMIAALVLLCGSAAYFFVRAEEANADGSADASVMYIKYE